MSSELKTIAKAEAALNRLIDKAGHDETGEASVSAVEDVLKTIAQIEDHSLSAEQHGRIKSLYASAQSAVAKAHAGTQVEIQRVSKVRENQRSSLPRQMTDRLGKDCNLLG